MIVGFFVVAVDVDERRKTFLKEIRLLAVLALPLLLVDQFWEALIVDAAIMASVWCAWRLGCAWWHARTGTMAILRRGQLG